MQDQIDRVKPRILIPMGNTALHALKTFIPQLKRVKLQTHAGREVEGSPTVVPLYHTSNRAVMTRRESDQRKDWTRLKKFISKL